MTGIDPQFSFYDDPAMPKDGDADRDSPMLRRAHASLWSKRLPRGELLALLPEWTWLSVTGPSGIEGWRLSSDTIATTHHNYPGIGTLWTALPPEDRTRYDRAFYTIGGFIVLPRHEQSLNQRRGNPLGPIKDRFDLTLECIRLYYNGITDYGRNPLGDVLVTDSAFFDLFGTGDAGFSGYVDFFHLNALVTDGRIRWFDGFDGEGWDFTRPPLPDTLPNYRRYLDQVLAFVQSRAQQMAASPESGLHSGEA